MRPALRARTVRVSSLREGERARMLSLMRSLYDDVSHGDFSRDLDAKQWVILLLDRAEGSLAGFSTIAMDPVRFRGRAGEVLFSGDTVIARPYWGQKVLDAAFARFLLWRKLRRPWRPFFWLLLSAGYKTYLLMLHSFPRAFPQQGVTPAPDAEALLRSECERRFPDAYDATSGVVRLARNYHVKEGVAPITPAELRHPDIAFFAARNPGHVKGDELAVLAEVRLGTLLAAMLRILRKRWFRRRRRGAEGKG